MSETTTTTSTELSDGHSSVGMAPDCSTIRPRRALQETRDEWSSWDSVARRGAARRGRVVLSICSVHAGR